MDDARSGDSYEALVQPEQVGPDLASYSTIIVAFSGGKDSLACLLHLLDQGVPRHKIELWHHDVDGREGSTLMDWPVTRDYCRAVAEAFGLPLYYSWKVGGFEREMLRDGVPTAPTRFEVPGGSVVEVGGDGQPGKRLRFPQVGASLTTRWCSAYLKIDPGSAAIRNQARFDGRRTLVVSGERAEESAARSRYATFEPDRADRRDGRRGRHVDRWRPIHGWREQQVWEIIERYRVAPHPAYVLGWGRVSCMRCIFGSKDQWASVAAIAPGSVDVIDTYEARFGVTINRGGKRVRELAVLGQPYPQTRDPALVATALSERFAGPVLLEPGAWKLPAGAYGESCGPT